MSIPWTVKRPGGELARAVVRLPDGSERDITDLVRILYDGVVRSLDWGSGWWTGEDAAAVGWIGLTFGWANGEDAERFAREIEKYQGFRQKLDAEIPPVPGRAWQGRQP